MLVWNLGCILVELLTSNHKFSTLEVMNKFKNQPFSFAALGMAEHIWKNFKLETHQLLSEMLHYNPSKRLTL